MLFVIALYVMCAVLTVVFFNRAGEKAVLFPLMWAGIITFALNVPVALFMTYKSSGNTLMGVHYDDVAMGLYLNLVYFLAWMIAYLLVVRHVHVRRRPLPRKATSEKVALPLLVVVFLAYAYTSVTYQTYGWGQSAYLQHKDASSSIGPLVSAASLLGPLLAAYLVFHHYRSQANYPSRLVRSPTVRWGLILSLPALALLSLAIWAQRGKFLASVALFLFAAICVNLIRRPVRYILGLGLAIILLSPIIEYVRSPYRGGGDWASSQEAYEKQMQHRTSGVSSTLDTIFEISAKNAILPVVSGAMHRHVESHGTVGLAPYRNTILGLIPRFLYRDKPFPMSSDGTPSGRPAIFLGAQLGGSQTSTWNAGGGIMYWQMGWFGVIIGGFLVGAIWAFMTVYTIRRRSFFALVLIFASFGWGLNLVDSLDFTIYILLENLRILAPIWIFVAVRTRLRRDAQRLAGPRPVV